MKQLQYTIILLATLLVLATPTLAETTYIQTQNGANQSIGNLPLYLDNTNNRIGVGTSSPSEKFHLVNGTIRSDVDEKLQEISSASTSTGMDLEIKNGILVSSFNNLETVDVSTDDMTVLDSISTDDSGTQFDWVGRYVYLADSTAGLTIYDVGNPSNIKKIGSYNFNGNTTRDVEVVGDTAYVATDETGIFVADVSDPSSPEQISTLSGSPWSLNSHGSYLYAPDSNDNLEIYNISDPRNPNLVGSAPIQDYGMDVEVQDGRAYVAEQNVGTSIDGRFEVFNVSDPENPEVLHTSSLLSGTARRLEVSDRYMHIAWEDSGYRVYDISNPSSPSLHASNTFTGGAYSVDISGGKAYIAEYNGPLRSIDIGGIHTPSIDTGSITSDTLDVDELKVSDLISADGGLTAGSGGIVSQGDITSHGAIEADKFVGDGSGLTNISSSGNSLWTNSSGNATYTGGNVGIGTSSPNSRLTVQGQSNDTFVVENNTGANLLEVDTKNEQVIISDPNNPGQELQISHEGSKTVNFHQAQNDLATFDFGKRPKFSAQDTEVFSIRSNPALITENDADLGENYGMWRNLYLSGNIEDSNDNEFLTFTSISNATNQIDIQNAPSGVGPVINATGDDSNVNLELATKGSGNIIANGITKIDGAVMTKGGIINGDASNTGIALGDVTTAKGKEGATALGDGTVASGSDGATALGQGGFAKGTSSITIGQRSSSNGDSSITIGKSLKATASNSFVIGTAPDLDTDPLLNDIPHSLMVGFEGNTSTLYVDNNSVGIGGITNGSTSTFEVNGTGRFRGDLNVTSSNDICIEGGNCLSSTGGTNPGGSSGAIQFNDGSGFAGNASKLFLNQSDGSIGVGTSSPDTDLHIVGEDGVRIRGDNGGSLTQRRYVQPTSGQTVGEFIFDGWAATQFAEGANIKAEATDAWSGDGPTRLVFSTASDGSDSPTERMRITPSGNIGIGTTSPNSALDVSGTAQASTSLETGSLVLHNSNGLYRGNSNKANVRFGSEKANGARPLILESGDGSSYTDGEIRLETDGQERVRVDDQGNVGVGTSSPNQSIEVDGGVRLNTTKTKPTCSNEQRGTMWFEKASAGSDDIIYSCMKNSSDNYNWVMVARGG